MNVWGIGLPCIYDLLLCCLYINVKENIICQNLRFFLLFMDSLLYQKPNVSSIISYVSRATVTAVTACVSEPTMLLTCCWWPYQFKSICQTLIISFLFSSDFLKTCWKCIYLIVFPKVLPSKIILFKKKAIENASRNPRKLSIISKSA